MNKEVADIIIVELHNCFEFYESKKLWLIEYDIQEYNNTVALFESCKKEIILRTR